jgi:hypothetical protein
VSLIAQGLRAAIEAGRRRAAEIVERGAAATAERDVARPLAVAPRAAVAPTLAVDRGAQPASRYAVTPRPRAPPAPPAPPKRLALPPPAPPPDLGLGVKPKGGQWLPDIKGVEGLYPDLFKSPEHVTRAGWEASAPGWNQRMGVDDPQGAALQDWWHKATTKYLKTGLGTPEDPMRDVLNDWGHIYPRGFRGDGDWVNAVDKSLTSTNLGNLTVPMHTNQLQPLLDKYGTQSLETLDPVGQLRERMATEAPWLSSGPRSPPVTEPLHLLHAGSEETLGLPTFAGAIHAAMTNPDLPRNLAIDPEGLKRMTLPQAVARAGEAHNWVETEGERLRTERENEASRAVLSTSPAVQTVRDYPDLAVNPKGYHWIEHRVPEGMPPEEGQAAVAQSLKAEGDAMDHCVGGYCAPVVSKESRIFSLHDAQGNPHVTIETNPGPGFAARAEEHPELNNLWNQYYYGEQDVPQANFRDYLEQQHPHTVAKYPDVFSTDEPDFLGQIMGHGNHAPKDEHLPYIQDFVRSQGPWEGAGHNVLKHAQMVQLPDKRMIPQSDYESVAKDLDTPFQSWDFNARGFPRDPTQLGPDDWEQFGHNFAGYARGGLVVRRRAKGGALVVTRRAA